MRAGTDAEVARLVEDLLERFALAPAADADWRRHLRDLRWVLTADYAEAVDRHVRGGDLAVPELIARARPLLPDFNRAPLRFEASVARLVDAADGPRLRLRTSRHGRLGDPLRGFYHRADAERTVVWLNLGHLPTAVAATFAHEVGHWFWDELQANPAATHAFYNVDYAAHLDDARELFADAFAALAAYPQAQARQLFDVRRWPFGDLRRHARENVVDVQRYLVREYAGDLGPRSKLPIRCRLMYMISMIHFARLRTALLHVVGA